LSYKFCSISQDRKHKNWIHHSQPFIHQRFEVNEWRHQSILYHQRAFICEHTCIHFPSSWVCHH